MTDDEYVDIASLREAVDSTIGAFRLYLRRDHAAMEPLVTPFSLEDLESAFGYLMSAVWALDNADNKAVAERIRHTGVGLRQLDPNPEPEMSLALHDVADSLEGATVVGEDGLDFPGLHGGKNSYPYVMAFCLALSIAHMRWSANGPEGMTDVLDDVAAKVHESLDYAEVVYQESAVAPFAGGKSPEEWIAGVTALNLMLLDWKMTPAEEVAEWLADKQPIEVGPFIMESLIAVASAAAHDVDDALRVLKEMARLGTVSPAPDNIAHAVEALTTALGKTKMHPTADEQMFTPMGTANAATAEEFIAAAAHVVEALLVALPGGTEELRHRFLSAMVRAANTTN